MRKPDDWGSENFYVDLNSGELRKRGDRSIKTAVQLADAATPTPAPLPIVLPNSPPG